MSKIDEAVRRRPWKNESQQRAYYALSAEERTIAFCRAYDEAIAGGLTRREALAKGKNALYHAGRQRLREMQGSAR